MQNKIELDLFAPITNAGCSCSCSCGPSILDDNKMINQQLIDMGKAVKESIGGSIKIKYANYSTSKNVIATINKLNKILTKSRIKFVVDSSNFFTFMDSVAPIIAINGMIYHTKVLPLKEELIKNITEYTSEE